jgi:Domain of unknown function (DUF4349)
MGTTRARLAAAAALLTAGFVVTGCSGSDSGSGTSASGGSSASRGEVADGAVPAPKAADGQSDQAGKQAGQQQPSLARAIVRTGYLTLESANIQQARNQINTLARGYDGEIANEETGTDNDGKIDHATLVVKVPTASYDRAMTDFQRSGTVKQVRQESTDVTEQVVDVNSRVASQRAGIARMRSLMARANTVGEVISVESELTRREADLESLLARQKALAAQTELATITVTLNRPGEAPPPAKDHSGFFGGLSAGWDAFTATVKALATAAGALLPFAVAGLVIAVPVWLYFRRRRTTEPTQQTPPQAQT